MGKSNDLNYTPSTWIVLRVSAPLTIPKTLPTRLSGSFLISFPSNAWVYQPKRGFQIGQEIRALMLFFVIPFSDGNSYTFNCEGRLVWQLAMVK